MADKYADIAFTGTVKSIQKDMGSHRLYAGASSGPDYYDRLRPSEITFIAERDSFYIASASQTGWPYVQFRGGPPGFLRALDETTLGFADFRGNRQYITTGNVTTNDRVSLFLMDYVTGAGSRSSARCERSTWMRALRLVTRLAVANYRVVIERAAVIKLEAFSWNCPQHITPRYTRAELADLLQRSRRPRHSDETCEPK
jgi:uncharacterized protein